MSINTLEQKTDHQEDAAPVSGIQPITTSSFEAAKFGSETRLDAERKLELIEGKLALNRVESERKAGIASAPEVVEKANNYYPIRAAEHQSRIDEITRSVLSEPAKEANKPSSSAQIANFEEAAKALDSEFIQKITPAEAQPARAARLTSSTSAKKTPAPTPSTVSRFFGRTAMAVAAAATLSSAVACADSNMGNGKSTITASAVPDTTSGGETSTYLETTTDTESSDSAQIPNDTASKADSKAAHSAAQPSPSSAAEHDPSSPKMNKEERNALRMEVIKWQEHYKISPNNTEAQNDSLAKLKELLILTAKIESGQWKVENPGKALPDIQLAMSNFKEKFKETKSQFPEVLPETKSSKPFSKVVASWMGRAVKAVAKAVGIGGNSPKPSAKTSNPKGEPAKGTIDPVVKFDESESKKAGAKIDESTQLVPMRAELAPRLVKLNADLDDLNNGKWPASKTTDLEFKVNPKLVEYHAQVSDMIRLAKTKEQLVEATKLLSKVEELTDGERARLTEALTPPSDVQIKKLAKDFLTTIKSGTAVVSEEERSTIESILNRSSVDPDQTLIDARYMRAMISRIH